MHQNALFKHVDGLCPSETFDVRIVLGKTLSFLLKNRSGNLWEGMLLNYNGNCLASGSGIKRREVHSSDQKGKIKSVFVTKGETH